MISAIQVAFTSLIASILNIYIFFFLIRLLLPKVTALQFNPLYRFIIGITEPTLKPIRGYLPKKFFIDLELILVILLLQSVRVLIEPLGLVLAQTANFNWSATFLVGLAMLAIGQVLLKLGLIIFWSVLIKSVANLLIYGRQQIHPFFIICDFLALPWLHLIRRFMPCALAGLDFSPCILLLALQMLDILLVTPLLSFAASLL